MTDWTDATDRGIDAVAVLTGLVIGAVTYVVLMGLSVAIGWTVETASCGAFQIGATFSVMGFLDSRARIRMKRAQQRLEAAMQDALSGARHAVAERN